MSTFENDTLKPIFLDEEEEEIGTDIDEGVDEKKNKHLGDEEYNENEFEDEEDGGVDLDGDEEEEGDF
ncbi:MAG: hypothetical protein AAB840_00605 [Patescibacteria group bacterium]